MIPGSFDIDTAKEVLGDSVVREIEAAARAAAERGEPLIPFELTGATYWDRVLSAMRHVVWAAAHDRRVARMARIKKAAK